MVIHLIIASVELQMSCVRLSANRETANDAVNAEKRLQYALWTLPHSNDKFIKYKYFLVVGFRCECKKWKSTMRVSRIEIETEIMTDTFRMWKTWTHFRFVWNFISNAIQLRFRLMHSQIVSLRVISRSCVLALQLARMFVTSNENTMKFICTLFLAIKSIVFSIRFDRLFNSHFVFISVCLYVSCFSVWFLRLFSLCLLVWRWRILLEFYRNFMRKLRNIYFARTKNFVALFTSPERIWAISIGSFTL